MFNKSILRSIIIDGGVPLSNTTRIIDLLEEFASSHKQIKLFGYGGGGAISLFGFAISAANPTGFICVILGAIAAFKAHKHKITNVDEREFRLLSLHRDIFLKLDDIQRREGLSDEKLLSAYESLISRYDRVSDEVVINPSHRIAAGDAIAAFSITAAQLGTDQPALPQPSKPSFFSTQLKPNSAPATQTDAPAQISNNTRFGAIDVPTQSVPPADSQLMSDVSLLNRTLQKPDEIGLPNQLRAVTVKKPYSTFIFGQSEAGKDITLYNIMGELKQSYPHAYFLGIDGKNSAGESELWNLYNRTIRISMRDNPSDYHSILIKALDDAIDHPGIAFVAFSEVNGISAAYNVRRMTAEWSEVAFRIAYLAIQGNSEQKFFYGTAQALNLDSLGIKKESRANIHFLAIANSTHFGFLTQMASDVNVFNNKLLLSQDAFQSACSRSTATHHLKNHAVLKGIGFFHTALNRWEPMPRLFNPGAERGEFPTITPAAESTEKLKSEPIAPKETSQDFDVDSQKVSPSSDDAQRLWTWFGGAGSKHIRNSTIAISDIKQHCTIRYKGKATRMNDVAILKELLTALRSEGYIEPAPNAQVFFLVDPTANQNDFEV